MSQELLIYVHLGILYIVDADDTVIELVGLMFDKDLSEDRVLFSSCYTQLNTDIKCLDIDDENYDIICKYIENTHGPTHNFKVIPKNIFSVYRKGEYWSYKPNKAIGNRKLLWHGLLTEPPANVNINGKMFGNGVYFTDVVTKAAQYSKNNIFSTEGILILAEVALGKHYYKTKSEKVEKLPEGKNSVKGLGKYKPKRTEIIRNKYGTQIPLGPLECHNDLSTDLNYSEYIVFDNNQIFMQYLVHCKFDGMGCEII
ncbi:poly [ADP-ribose] polymerase 1-like [Condylostylus longicornis]|uniref:poly [ADP-ribose] polymerase 1-like n=1 Tax=Condylostylus longicornis TaxID=2530218 RepID=UPI00244DEB17|nr:poly [ADP-ribose] polymerase 1-like [Condylostylus longicornis]